MSPSPFAHRNAAMIRAERRDRITGAAHLIAAGLLALGLFALARAALLTAVALPEIIARSAAAAAW